MFASIVVRSRRHMWAQAHRTERYRTVELQHGLQRNGECDGHQTITNYYRSLRPTPMLLFAVLEVLEACGGAHGEESPQELCRKGGERVNDRVLLVLASSLLNGPTDMTGAQEGNSEKRMAREWLGHY